MYATGQTGIAVQPFQPLLNFKQHTYLKKWQERSHLESHTSVVLLVQLGELRPKHPISTQALLFSAAEYSAPVWSRRPHVKKVDVAIKSSLRTISGCLKPTPVFRHHVLAGIAPAGVRPKSSHPRLGTECSETRLEHPARHLATGRLRRCSV